MIPSIPLPWQAKTWQTELSGAITDVKDLAAILELSFDNADWDLNPAFPMRVPMAYVSRMRRGDRNDPLLRQVIPELAEKNSIPDFEPDPLMKHLEERFKKDKTFLCSGSCYGLCFG